MQKELSLKSVADDCHDERDSPDDKRCVDAVPSGESDNLDQHDSKDLFESILWRVDANDSTLLVVAGSRVPDSTRSLSHSEVLRRLRDRLERFAERGPYSVVLLANPTRYAPSTRELISTYLTISHVTRKNLDKLWVVGGSWWTRTILTVFTTTLLSLKVSRKQKIVQCSNLNSLANELGTELFTSIEFPPEVYVEDAKISKEGLLQLPRQALPPVFGTPLASLCQIEGDQVTLPQILDDCFRVLLAHGPSSVGIFRRSPSASTVRILEQAYDRHHKISLESYPDSPHLAASLLKSFLRSLPDPILPRAFYENDRPLVRRRSEEEEEGDGEAKEHDEDDDRLIDSIRTRLRDVVGRPERFVVERLAKVLHRISHDSRENLMSSSNLVVCVAPCLVGGIERVDRYQVETIRSPLAATIRRRRRHPRDDNEKDEESRVGGDLGIGGTLRVIIERYGEIFEDETEDVERCDHSSRKEKDEEEKFRVPEQAQTRAPRLDEDKDELVPRRVNKPSSDRRDVRGVFVAAASTE
ncbi:hypothetical protein JCM3766R1_002237 [Sporobolomyces carnicolor]